MMEFYKNFRELSYLLCVLIPVGCLVLAFLATFLFIKIKANLGDKDLIRFKINLIFEGVLYCLLVLGAVSIASIMFVYHVVSMKFYGL